MAQQSIRQAARRAALAAQSTTRRERAEKDKRLQALAVQVQVLVAVGERDAAVTDAEHRAGQALRQMTEDEGLTVREAVHRCGDQITVREATRLRRLPTDDPVREAGPDDQSATDVHPVAPRTGRQRGPRPVGQRKGPT